MKSEIKGVGREGEGGERDGEEGWEREDIRVSKFAFVVETL